MGLGRGGRNLKISAKNAVFVILNGKKQISSLLEKSTVVPPLEKFLPKFRRPCTQACKITPFLRKFVLYYTIWQHCSTAPMW